MRQIEVVGLGPGAPGLLPSGALAALRRGWRNVLRTAVHPIVPWLVDQGIPFETCDDAYREEATFDAVYARIAATVLAVAREENVVFAVPGHPRVAERSVALLLERGAEAGVEVVIGPGASCVDSVCAAVGWDPLAGLLVLDALDLPAAAAFPARTPAPLLILQIYQRSVASTVKLWLMSWLDDDHSVCAVRAAGVPGLQRVEWLPLHALDRDFEWDHLSSLWVPPPESDAPDADGSILPLVEVVRRLRAPNGCPWDRQQTHASLRPYVIEEAFEVAEAIDSGEPHNLREELGDLLLQIVLHCAIAAEEDRFDLADVVQGAVAKLVRRHPHVFGKRTAADPGEVRRLWQEMKELERGVQKSLLDGVSPALPALQRAYRLGQKAAEVGFDWPRLQDAWAKVIEEMAELEAAWRASRGAEAADELGDCLFALCNVARFLHVDPEGALGRAASRFSRRFRRMERHAQAAGRSLAGMAPEEMDALWQRAKRERDEGGPL